MAKKSLFGIARWIFEGDTKPLEKSAEEAKQTVKDVGNTAEAEGKKVSGAFERMGDSIEGSTVGLRKFVGALGSTLGVVTGLLGVVGLLAGAFIALKSALERLNDPSKGVTKTTENLDALFDNLAGAAEAGGKFPVFDQLNENIDELSERIIKLEFMAADFGTGDSPIQDVFKVGDSIRDLPKLRAELQKMLELRQELLERTREAREVEASTMGDEAVERFRKNAEATEQYLKTLTEQTKQMRISLIGDDAARIKAEADSIIEQAARVQKELGFSADDEAFQGYIDAIRAGERVKLQELEKRKALEDAAAAERDRKMVESFEKAAEAFADALTFSTANFTTRLDTIVREIQQVSRTNGRR
jgi:hypothetical protein